VSVIGYDILNQGEVSTDRRGVKWVKDRYLVEVDDESDSLSILQRDLAELQRWQRHPNEPGMFVDSFKGSQQPNELFWWVDVEYTNTIDNDPMAAPARFSSRTQSLQSYTLVDRDGRPLLNTAGDLIVPIPRKELIVVYTVRKNLAPQFPQWLNQFGEAVNADSVNINGLICPPNTLTVGGITIEDEQEANGFGYRPVSLEIHYRQSGWSTLVPSMGFREKLLDEDGQPVLENIMEHGKPIKRAMLLDEDGRAIKDPQVTDTVLLKFDILHELPFSELPLT
jgi:hypothetical protein